MLRIFHHYIPTSIVWLILVEFVVLVLSVYIGIEVRFVDSPEGKALLEPFFPKAVSFSLSMILAMTAMGLHTRNIISNVSSLLIRLALSLSLGFLITILIFYIYPPLFLGRGCLHIQW